VVWHPILEGELAERAWEAARAIADDVAKSDVNEPDAALFWSYFSTVFEDELTATRAEAALTKFARKIESGVPGLRLYGGLPGTGWVAAHVADDVEEFLAIVDEAVNNALAIDHWPADYDLIGGLAGLAVYFLERGEAPAATTGLRRIVEVLGTLAERTPNGTTWHTKPELLPEHQRRIAPEGYYNCGLAHGVPGVLGVLARIAKRPDAPAEAIKLRDETMRWMRAQRLDGGGFPGWITKEPSTRTRIAWCYGDPGVALSLASAGAPPDELASLNEWITYPFDKTGIIDAGVCHGAAGLAHVCNRFYQATGDKSYCSAARRWYEQALEMRKPGEGIGGYTMYFPKPDLSPDWRASPDFLDGAIGIGLAFLAGVTSVEPEWDRLILSDLPVKS
jgi:class I lanthipeptide synthase